VSVPTGPPFGNVDRVAAGVGSVSVSGWAIDPDTAASIQVQVVVDGDATVVTADGSRPDVGAVYGGYGPAHGWSLEVAVGTGVHSVCAYGLNAGPGRDAALGCRSVEVRSGSPFGSLDGAARNPSGTISVAGWAIDPDTTSSIQVQVYLAGAGYPLTGYPVTAGLDRPDVGDAFPGYGSAHGFATTVASAPSGVTVCAYGVNVARGATSVLGCRIVR
jgi:hypothetical protein